MDLNALYDSIDLGKIDEFIDSQREEDLHLDFKRLNDPKMNKDDRKNFAKALLTNIMPLFYAKGYVGT